MRSLDASSCLGSHAALNQVALCCVGAEHAADRLCFNALQGITPTTSIRNGTIPLRGSGALGCTTVRHNHPPTAFNLVALFRSAGLAFRPVRRQDHTWRRLNCLIKGCWCSQDLVRTEQGSPMLPDGARPFNFVAHSFMRQCSYVRDQ
eukprot:2564281-Amphidinium_carterae.1